MKLIFIEIDSAIRFVFYDPNYKNDQDSDQVNDQVYNFNTSLIDIIFFSLKSSQSVFFVGKFSFSRIISIFC